MRSLILFFFMLIGAVTAVAQPPDTLWTSTFGGHYYDVGHTARVTVDGGFVLVGTTDRFGDYLYDVWLVKTDSAGNRIWEQTYGGLLWDEGRSVEQTTDGGYIIGGSSADDSSEMYDFYLVKTDSLGNQEWDRTFGTVYNDNGECVQQTADGGYVLAGRMCSLTPPLSFEFGLVKTDTQGNEEWRRTYGGEEDDECHCVRQTRDGGYILAGETWSYGGGLCDFYLVKVDAAGNLQWERTYGIYHWEYCYTVRQTADGGYILGGTTSIGSGYWDVYVVKTDSLGNPEWEQNFGPNIYEGCWEIEQTSDGGYILAGTTFYHIGGPGDAYLVKLDPQGNLEWDQTYQGDGYDYCYSMQPLPDGGYILGGATMDFDGFYQDMWLVRVASPSVPNLELSVTYISGSPVPAGGGNIYYDIFCENVGLDPTEFDGWMDISYAGGVPTTLAQRHFDNFMPGWTINRPNMVFPVPAAYAAGNYHFLVRVGYHPNITWAEDGFSFIKSGTDAIPGFVPWTPDGMPNPFEEFTSRQPLATNHRLVTAYPNPFNPTTVVSYTLQAVSHVSLSVYDTTGKKVTELVHGWRDAGVHEVTFDGSGLASGVYIIRMEAGEFSEVGKMVLMK